MKLEVMFVGDGGKDVVGALAAGMSAVLSWRADDRPPAWGQRASRQRRLRRCVSQHC